MGLYIRKALRVGPFRFNLSKSGVGVSAGVKGFRVGTGPRGNYVHMGRGGLYYRHTFSKKRDERAYTQSTRPSTSEHYQEPAPLTHEPLKEIESGDIMHMVDGSSAELVEELNSKRKMSTLMPVIIGLGAVALAYTIYRDLPYLLPITIGCILAVILARYRDVMNKTSVIIYDIEDEFEENYNKLINSFDEMKAVDSCWHMEAEGRVHDSKYHAGASSVVERKPIQLSFTSPPFVKTNIQVPSIPVGKQTLYFFPDRVLVFEPYGVGAVSYENLEVKLSPTRFVEDGSVPKDTKIIDYTWEYVNKQGGPDRRFKNNHRIPVVRYEDLHLFSKTGMNERISLSKVGAASSFVLALKRFREAQKNSTSVS
ncbi:DUF4236 domain-containing protein [Halomonas sp. SL1]|uniref:DUF4236 domain-containing protein n=1 Tax=Halomonas sp. SL1 TaxID=2137478 RepID=UPI000D17BF66|nr:DUF4236 domain-containing protein [Halomonas sp. SL1]RAH36509.1 DUF4236 domain-containing protein [Halomonas sp. SL1]